MGANVEHGAQGERLHVKPVADAVHAAGGAIGPQIWHASSIQSKTSDWQPDAPLLEEVGALINQQTVAGSRYPAAMQKTIDTEEFT